MARMKQLAILNDPRSWGESRLSALGDQDDIAPEPLSDDALAEREADALATWTWLLDARELDAAEAARLEILATRRDAGYDAAMDPF